MFRNLAYSSVSSGTAALLLILMIVAGRVLGEVEFGKFAFALLLGGIFETTMDFGLHQVTIRAVARDPSRATNLLHHTLAIKLLWVAGTLAALIVTATLLRPQWDVRWACYLIGGSLVFRSYMLTIRGVLQGLERFGWDSLVVLADRGLLLALGVAALMSGTGLRGLTIASRRSGPSLRSGGVARAAPHRVAARIFSRGAEPVFVCRRRHARRDANGCRDRPLYGGLQDL